MALTRVVFVRTSGTLLEVAFGWIIAVTLKTWFSVIPQLLGLFQTETLLVFTMQTFTRSFHFFNSFILELNRRSQGCLEE